MGSELTEAERATLNLWDDGSYTCARQRGTCNDRCANTHRGLADEVARMLAARERQAARDALLGAAEEMDELRAETYGPDVFIRPSVADYMAANELLKANLGWQTDRIGADCYDRAIGVQAARLRDRADSIAPLGDAGGEGQ